MSKTRLICMNDKCINKSPVFRNENTLDGWFCKGCGFKLSHYVGQLERKQNEKAKKELGELNV